MTEKPPMHTIGISDLTKLGEELGPYGDIRDKLIRLQCPWLGFGASYVVSDIFPVRHQIVSELNKAEEVRSIFEFGSYYGYCLVTLLDAAPACTWVGWCDRDLEANERWKENLALYVAENPRRWKLRLAGYESSRDAAASIGAPVDVISVDGDHSGYGCLADLTMALTMRPRMILVDDYTAISEVRYATERFCAYFDLEDKVELHETVNGLAVIRP